jgi:hypothetical protein
MPSNRSHCNLVLNTRENKQAHMIFAPSLHYTYSHVEVLQKNTWSVLQKIQLRVTIEGL